MPARYTSARFVGRDEAFASLAAALDDAAHGRARTVLLDGTAGVGASRFLDEVIVRIDGLRSPMTVLRAAAWPAHADEPYGPIVRAIGPSLRAKPPADLADLLGPATSEVVRLLPDLAPRLAAIGAPTGSGGTTAPERRQARTLEGILGLLGRLGDEHPVVLILEDLHLADAATRALVTFLSRIARDQRLLIVGTHQSDAMARDDPWMADLRAIESGPRPPERLTLPPLDRDGLAALIEGIEGERASASLLLLVAERSGGLPLVAEELLAARRELPSASLTGSFDELIIARLAVRSQECRRVLRLISLVDRPLPADQLAAVGAAFEQDASRSAPRSVTGPRIGDGILDADLLAGRTEALANGFLVEVDGGIAFRHASIGRAVARDLLPIARTRHHAALAASLDGPPAAVAWHWLSAYDPVRARTAAIEAAAFAATRHAAADELAALELALSLPSAPVPGPSARRRAAPVSDRVDLQVRASEAAFAVGQFPRATAFLESGIAGLDARRDRVRLGLLHARLANIRRAAGDPAGAMLAARRAVELVPREASPERASVLAGLAQLKMLDGIFSEAQRLARDAIKVARSLRSGRAGRGDPRRHDAGGRVGVGQRPGDLDRPPSGRRASRARDGRPGCAVPDPGQPDDRPRPRRPTDRGRRRGLRGDRRCPAGGPGSRLRQLPGGQRGRYPAPARPLVGGAHAQRPGDELAAGRRRLPGVDPAARHPRDRDGRRRGGGPAPRSDDPRVRCRPGAATGRPVLPRGRVVCAVARRHRRCRPVGRSGLGERPGHRGVAARRADGLDGRPGRRGGRHRSARPPTARPARGGSPADGGGRRDGHRPGARLGSPGIGRDPSDRRRVAGDGASVPAPPRGRRRCGRLAAGRVGLGGARRPVRRGPRPLAPGRGDPGVRDRPIRPDARPGAAAAGRRDRPVAVGQAAPARTARARGPGADHPPGRGRRHARRRSRGRRGHPGRRGRRGRRRPGGRMAARTSSARSPASSVSRVDARIRSD